MINFTVGPVQSSKSVCSIGAEQVPYFRTNEFSKLMLENEKLIKKLSNAGDDSRVVFITGSGTASMEATVANTLTKEDKVLIVNGGSFGQRFVELCQIYDIEYQEIKLDVGKSLKENDLSEFDGQGFTAFLVNIHETSTGVLYDIDLITKFCMKNNLFLIVDAISSFLADEIDMIRSKIDVLITGSQKALACPPGISIIVLSNEALSRIEESDAKCMYLNLKRALKDGKRGQTPFTPAVGILRQINCRLKDIEVSGGVKKEIEKVSLIANDFRQRISNLPLEFVSESMSNAVTSLHPLKNNAKEIFTVLKDEYGIWVCPNGGDLENMLVRVGHIGELTVQDNDILISALNDMKIRGIL